MSNKMCKCGGLIMEADKVYGYAGKICRCPALPSYQQITLPEWGQCGHGKVGLCYACNPEPLDEATELRSKLSAAEKERDDLKAKLAVAVEALTSIASPHIGKSRKESYWLSLPHEACAEVLATDVDIAREALKAINGGE